MATFMRPPQTRALALVSCLVIVALVSGALAVVTYRDVLREEWQEFKAKHNKVYADQSEDNYRFKVFLTNKHLIAKHNQRHANGEASYTLGLNKYADMTHQEFVRIMNGYRPHLRKPNDDSHTDVHHEKRTLEEPFDIPRSVDWRKHGFVTPIKDQGQCGSCWAFSATGALEGQHYKRTGDLISLSEQNLVDCSKVYGNMGCEGGLMDDAFKYVRDNHGVDTENSYPYEAHDGRCRFRNATVGADDKGYVDLPSGDEAKLTKALAMKGPISVAIDASQESFRLYSGGVYDEINCSSEHLDHGVLAVGYDTDPIHGDYYIVKNSWSETWGHSGYIKMARNKDNQCGIASAAVYPVV